MKSFFSIPLISLSVLIVLCLWHYRSFDRGGYDGAIRNLSASTGIFSPAFGASWYEPRMRGYDDRGNGIYPELPPIDRSVFAYGVRQ